jgi:hypothetical protein
MVSGSGLEGRTGRVRPSNACPETCQEEVVMSEQHRRPRGDAHWREVACGPTHERGAPLPR